MTFVMKKIYQHLYGAKVEVKLQPGEVGERMTSKLNILLWPFTNPRHDNPTNTILIEGSVKNAFFPDDLALHMARIDSDYCAVNTCVSLIDQFNKAGCEEPSVAEATYTSIFTPCLG